MNVIHSIDGYLLRSVIRRASYDHKKVATANGFYIIELEKRNQAIQALAVLDDRLKNMLTIYEYSKMLDVAIIDYITDQNIGCVSTELLSKLVATLSKMLELGSSPVLTVHDAFRMHCNHANTVRYWYKEIMSELAESDILQFIVSQIVGKQVKYIKKSNNLPDMIRNSSYAIC